jgi:two-component system NtrC family sensor kinase
MEVQIETLSVNEVIQETLTFLGKEVQYRNIDLSLNLAEDLPPIDSDRGQLQQVFLNLLNNSLAAVEDGVQICLSTCRRDPETLAIMVRVNGCGMNEETLQHIFEPFFTTKRGTGTGLGLPITYGIIKRLGGSIAVESREGEGTTITVCLPLKPGKGSGA